MRCSRVWIALGLSATTACAVAEIPSSTDVDVANLAERPSAPSAPAACSPATASLAPPDVARLARCECKSGGLAHCLPLAQTPGELSSQLEKCEGGGGACVPDTVLANPGPLPAYKSAGKDGRCLSMCVPLVAKYGQTLLTRGDGDACPADERCVPCKSPLDGTSTGVCEVGSPPPATCGALGDGGQAASATPKAKGACCNSKGKMRGTCVSPATVADDLRERLSQRECDTADVCMPIEGVDHSVKPTTCGGGIGVCMSDCVTVGITERLLDLVNCASDETCVPCKSMLTLQPKDYPGCN